MSRLRRYLNRQGDGAVMQLAELVGLSHAQVSRIADGHRGTSAEKLLKISRITGIPPHLVLSTSKAKKASRSRQGRNR